MKRIVVLIVLAATLHGCALAPAQTTKADAQTVPVPPPPAAAPMKDWTDRDVYMPIVTTTILTAIGAFIVLSFIHRDRGNYSYSSEPQDPCSPNDPQRPSWCP